MVPSTNGVLKTIAIALGIVGTIGGGIWAQELRYAKAADLAVHVDAHKQEARDFKLDILESRRQALRARIFEMEQAQKTRKGGLTAEEQKYLDEQKQQYQDVTEKIKRASK